MSIGKAMTESPDSSQPTARKNVLVLVRHGESEWNRLNRFTGWKDVGLTEEGMAEAHLAGTMLKDSASVSTAPSPRHSSARITPSTSSSMSSARANSPRSKPPP